MLERGRDVVVELDPAGVAGMMFARLRFSLLMTTLAIWLAALVASGTVAIAAFTTLPDLDVSNPTTTRFFANDPQGAGRYLAGFVTNPVFVISDRIRGVAAVLIVVIFAIGRGRVLDGRCRTIRHLAHATLLGAIGLLAYEVFLVAPDVQSSLAAWRSTVVDGDVERGAHVWKRFRVLHEIASTLLRVELTLVLGSFLLAAFAGSWSSRPGSVNA